MSGICLAQYLSPYPEERLQDTPSRTWAKLIAVHEGGGETVRTRVYTNSWSPRGAAFDISHGGPGQLPEGDTVVITEVRTDGVNPLVRLVMTSNGIEREDTHLSLYPVAFDYVVDMVLTAMQQGWSPEGEPGTWDDVTVAARAALVESEVMGDRTVAAQADLAYANTPFGPPGMPVWRAAIVDPQDSNTRFASAVDLSLPAGLVGIDDVLNDGPAGVDVLVAVLDTGCGMPTHPGLVNVVSRLDATGTNPSGRDTNNHGTWCCGAIVGTSQMIGRDVAPRGLAPFARVISIQVLTAGGWGSEGMIERGIRMATRLGCHIISMSLGGSSAMPAVERALSEARAAGVLVVAAAGNEGGNGDTVGYPGRYGTVLCVGSVDSQTGTRPSSFSSRGPTVDVVAPGEQLAGYNADGTIWRPSGTSMATPLVAAALARAVSLAKRNGWYDQLPADADEACDAVPLGATPIPDLPKGYGIGRASYAGTVRELDKMNAPPAAPPVDPPAPPTPPVDPPAGVVVPFPPADDMHVLFADSGTVRWVRLSTVTNSVSAILYHAIKDNVLTWSDRDDFMSTAGPNELDQVATTAPTTGPDPATAAFLAGD